MPNYWLISTSPEDFKIDREIGFSKQGLRQRNKKMVKRFKPGDRVVYHITKISKLGAIATITSGYYYDDKTKIWADETEIWPVRTKSEPYLVLEDDELLDLKKLVKNLSFINDKVNWGMYLRGSLRPLPEEDYQLIESEMRKVLSRRKIETEKETDLKTEKDCSKAIMKLPLNSRSLHDRIGEMLQTVGSWMGYNTNSRSKITSESAYELDVAWLSGKNPEVAIEVQIGGSIDSAIRKLREAREFNYRKVILVIEADQISRLNAVIRFDSIRNWLDAWSIRSVYELYTNGQRFFQLYDKLKEARYRERTELELI
jgi:predicted RNA-binding protein